MQIFLCLSLQDSHLCSLRGCQHYIQQYACSIYAQGIPVKPLNKFAWGLIIDRKTWKPHVGFDYCCLYIVSGSQDRFFHLKWTHIYLYIFIYKHVTHTTPVQIHLFPKESSLQTVMPQWYEAEIPPEKSVGLLTLLCKRKMSNMRWTKRSKNGTKSQPKWEP